MDQKVKGVVLGVAGVILWFMPMAAWEQVFMGRAMVMHQAGHHIGGIAYLLLLSSMAYAALSWYEQHQLRMIAAGIAVGIGLLFLVQAGSTVAWGLLTLIAVSGASLWFAYTDKKKSAAKSTA